MSYLRFTLDVAVKQPLPAALQTALPAIRQKIRDLKAYASKINEGQPNEEMTVKTKYHICHHDTNEPCEPENEI